MALDPSIALRINPMRVESQDNALMRIMSLQGAMRQNELGGLQLEQAKQQGQQEQAWRAGLGANDPATPEGLSALMRIDPARAAAIQKAQLEGRNVQSQIDRRGVENTKTAAEVEKIKAEEKRRLVQDNLQRLGAVNDAAGAQAWIRGGVQSGLIDFKQAQAAMQAVPADPQAFAQWKRAQMMAGVEIGKQFDLANADRTHGLELDKFGEVKANNVRVDQRIRSEGAANRGVQVRGQNMTDARARETADIQKQAGRSQVIETADGVMIVDKGTGLARPAATMSGQALAGKIPEAQRKEIMSINQQRAVVSGALKAVEGTPSAFTMGRGMATMAGAIPESMAGRFDSSPERQARSFVFNNVSAVINERAGAAQSAQELARLRSFLPAETDNSQQIVDKLKAFNLYLDDKERGTATPAGVRTPSKPSAPMGAPKFLGFE